MRADVQMPSPEDPTPEAEGPDPIRVAEGLTGGILAVVVVTLAFGTLRGLDLSGELLAHGGLGAAFLLGVALLPRRAERLRSSAVVAVMFTLYFTLGQVAFEAVPYLADPWLESADRVLFGGTSPSLWLDQQAAAGDLGRGAVELLSVGYALFIPFLNLSLLAGLWGKAPGARREMVVGFACLYALSFLGYLFLPARGPVVLLTDAFQADLDGGTFHRLVVDSVDHSGGPHGAFPSLHFGATLFLWGFDRRHDPTRAWIYAPLVPWIAAATVVLRYHYVVDLLAAVVLATTALWVGRRVVGRGVAGNAAGRAS
ncbi:MAG: phosphatase PAP2 family protein [Acidobacteriota bacterium]